jgi:hypothetical protein
MGAELEEGEVRMSNDGDGEGMRSRVAAADGQIVACTLHVTRLGYWW